MDELFTPDKKQMYFSVPAFEMKLIDPGKTKGNKRVTDIRVAWMPVRRVWRVMRAVPNPAAAYTTRQPSMMHVTLQEFPPEEREAACAFAIAAFRFDIQPQADK